ncbi:MAG: bifunctional folylpolyglutamate synthase/dihydrofolate synthase [Deltaproteobacteria bacterium CG_4_8_14_3_um_filter_51_11]|nr:bifunctional folylpolyglutamate synthase/dihydrofolate synthase [bacterium]OIP37715.1 MAG: hypothetical protein AUK25_14285 [Desulfobacteraceae bacterium CG2_30_51_40]PIP45712.1 MAG: bifunctional tetrahydrofolate synthase/dihydrofolate synthase [Deltaproteobacteria bacterium CG23_combo_of_CG06-09_8_20_14_all_51_20]PIX19982.1 MAG: bifunctional folylpolyglutamate synthase/dihydrofolate synthase [Deltaproteobacteria bacterium CG_4_8_14_3_um_filter_51_11]PIY23630.1 MAG: bifunctional folylpolyglu
MAADSNCGHSDYSQAVSYLYGLQKFGIKLGLDRTRGLLNALGNPHKGMKFIHVAGTNGKGSVCAFLESILKEAGFKVGFYSSPHLVRFTERFRINGREIGRDAVASLTDEVRAVSDPDDPPTFFEATTVMALSFFAREHTDFAIMEVGMGGRLDSTNVINPIAAGITNVSMEHQQYLGSRLLDIAYEKAGVIKEGLEVIAGVTQPPVVDLYGRLSSEKGARLLRVGKDIRYRTTSSGLHYYGTDRRMEGLELSLKGSFQSRNAAISLGIIEVMGRKGFKLDEDHVRAGLKSTFWPGRLHVFSHEPALVLDGSHNPGAIRTVVSTLDKTFSYKRLILVMGIMADKDIGSMLKEIVPIADHVIYTRPVYERAADPKVLYEKARGLGAVGEVAADIPLALERAKALADSRDLILVCGSLFTVGEALTYLDPVAYCPDPVRVY